MLPVQLRLARTIWVPVLAGVLGCDDSTGLPEASLRVRADKLEYSLDSDNAATAVLVNLGPTVVYAPMNEYVYVERYQSGRWGDRRGWFSVDGTSTSFPIHPGDSLVAWPMAFTYVDNRPGVYRFLFEVAFDPSGRRLVHESQRSSASFQLRP
jgi:hypothetical protein